MVQVANTRAAQLLTFFILSELKIKKKNGRRESQKY